MHSTLASIALLAILFIASTSYARPGPEQYDRFMEGEAMQKNQSLADIRSSNEKMKSDSKDELVEEDEHFPDFPIHETFPDFPIYDEPLWKSKETVGDEPKP